MAVMNLAARMRFSALSPVLAGALSDTSPRVSEIDVPVNCLQREVQIEDWNAD
jgi:hypothetical protein